MNYLYFYEKSTTILTSAERNESSVLCPLLSLATSLLTCSSCLTAFLFLGLGCPPAATWIICTSVEFALIVDHATLEKLEVNLTQNGLPQLQDP